jgi:hypothetical protein
MTKLQFTNTKIAIIFAIIEQEVIMDQFATYNLQINV